MVFPKTNPDRTGFPVTDWKSMVTRQTALATASGLEDVMVVAFSGRRGKVTVLLGSSPVVALRVAAPT
jgi:hypothetical protein